MLMQLYFDLAKRLETPYNAPVEPAAADSSCSMTTAQEGIHVGSGTSRPPRRFWVEITAILAAKAVALTALYLIFFSTPPQPDVAGHLFHVEDGK